MILAAGLGLRLRPITLHLPKPLIKVAGRTMLDRVLDHLNDINIVNRVINTYWLSEKIHQHLFGQKNIIFSDETDLLDTGGGVLQALPLLGSDPFFVCNADIIWNDGNIPALSRLAQAWDDKKMDALLLLHSTIDAFGYTGVGDFFMNTSGRAIRRRDTAISQNLFTGIQILHPRIFYDIMPGKFSLNLLYDIAETNNRLYAIIHDGSWYHIGTPKSVIDAESLIKN
jgi:MurNAc alpha-1-phosphate uridylyltransferase